MVKMLIDVDTGVDDSIALLYALNHPELKLWELQPDVEM